MDTVTDQTASVQSFGYAQQLKRSLKAFSIFGVAFSYMSITGAVFASFGIGLSNYGTASLLLWPVALVGQTLVALVVAELATRIPLAGYAYQWGGRLIATGYGYVVAIVTAAFLVAAAATLSYVLAAPFFEQVVGLSGTGAQTAIIATLIVGLCALINIFGIGAFARFNNLAVICEVLGTIGIGALVLATVLAKGTPHAPLYTTGGAHNGLIWGGILGALTMGMWSLCGFESAADLAEEVKDTKTLPRAIIGSVVGAGIIGFLCMSALSFGIQSDAKTAATGNPAIDIIQGVVGNTATRVLLILPLIAVLGSTLATITVLSRLIFALGRDNVAPGAKLLRSVNKARQTPSASIIVAAALGVALIWYANYQSSSFDVLIGATAILPYLLYLMLVAAYAARRHKLHYLKRPGSYDLGRFGLPIMIVTLIWVVFTLLVLTLPSEFHQAAEVVAVILVAAGAWYFIGFRGRVRRGDAGIPRLAGRRVETELSTPADTRGTPITVGGADENPGGV